MKCCNVLDLLQGNSGGLQCGKGGDRKNKIDKVFTIVELGEITQKFIRQPFYFRRHLKFFRNKKVTGVSWIKICHCTSLRGLGFSLSEVKSLSHVRLCNPVDCSPPGSSVHRILQARILEWIPISLLPPKRLF